jgi:archaellum component FlaC
MSENEVLEFLKGMQAQLNSRFDAIEARLSKLESRLASLEIDFRGLTQIVVGAVGTLNVLADRVTELEKAAVMLSA